MQPNNELQNDAHVPPVQEIAEQQEDNEVTNIDNYEQLANILEDFDQYIEIIGEDEDDGEVWEDAQDFQEERVDIIPPQPEIQADDENENHVSIGTLINITYNKNQKNDHLFLCTFYFIKTIYFHFRMKNRCIQEVL